MRRNFEKDRSAVAMVTGKVRNRSRQIQLWWMLKSVQCQQMSEVLHRWRAISDFSNDASVTSCTGNASLRSQLYSFCKAVVCDTMSCSGTEDKTLGKAILFITVNCWVSCDVTMSITQLKHHDSEALLCVCQACVFSQLIKMMLLFCDTYVLELGFNTPKVADSCCFIYTVA